MYRLIQICCSDAHLACSLAGALTTLKDCAVRVSTDWQPEKHFSLTQFQLQDLFAVIVSVDLDNSSEVETLRNWIEQIGTQSGFPKIILISNGCSASGQQIQIEMLQGRVFEILERPINFQRLRYILDLVAHDFDRVHNRRLADSLASGDGSKILAAQLTKLAKVETNVLFSGETGVGKTYCARQVHSMSSRARKPFVAVNCGNICPGLIESQFFGHAKGAFTGADTNHVGFFETARDGTIFLDEIDALPLENQSTLLRVVENREFVPLGRSKPLRMNARIISATNQNLETLVKKGAFRADLFYRLNTYEINVAPLNDRKQEIESFCHLFMKEFIDENHCSVKAIGHDLIEKLQLYTWPGNLRELRNCIYYAAIETDDGILRFDDIPVKIKTAILNANAANKHRHDSPFANITQADSHLDQDAFLEAQRLISALEKHKFNRSKAAEELGVSRMTVYNMLKRHQLD